MSYVYHVERRGFRYTPDECEVMGPDDRPIMRFSYEKHDEAQHLADLLNAAYHAGLESGMSAREDKRE